MSGEYGPKVRLATVRERTSASGNRYFSGFLGDASVLMFRDSDADNEWGEAWAVYVQERKKRQNGNGQGASQQRRNSNTVAPEKPSERAKRTAQEMHRPIGDGDDGRPFDDDIGF